MPYDYKLLISAGCTPNPVSNPAQPGVTSENCCSSTPVNGGKRKGRSYSMLRPEVLVSSAESNGPGHLFAVASTKRQLPRVVRRAKLEHHRGSALLVGGLEFRDEVVGANGPVDLLDARPVLVG
jgi:hypothetical protein